MENETGEFKMPSGNTLNVSPASFKSANELRKSIFKCLAGNGLGINNFKDGSAMQVIMSDEKVEACFFECARSAVYDGIKVTPDLFDDARSGKKARSDFFIIFTKVLDVNIDPFFPNPSSELRATPLAV